MLMLDSRKRFLVGLIILGFLWEMYISFQKNYLTSILPTLNISRVDSLSTGLFVKKRLQINTENENLDMFNSVLEIFRLQKNSSICRRSEDMSSGKFSRIHDLKINRTSGLVTFSLSTYNNKGYSKNYGGDVILVHAVKKDPERIRVAGRVQDHGNGKYEARVKMLWSGQTEIHVKIASKYENACRRFHAMFLYNDSVYAMENPHNVVRDFQNGSLIEETRCSPSTSIFGYTKLCNMTRDNYGLSFFCGHPQDNRLTCDNARKVSRTRNYPVIMKPTDIVHKPFIERIQESLSVNFSTKKGLLSDSLYNCSTRSPIESWTEGFPSGIGINGGWKTLGCAHEQIRTAREIRRCLTGKKVFVQGDSTVRQYFLTLIKYGEFKNHYKKVANSLVFYEKDVDLNMSWRVHEFPYHCGTYVRHCVPGSMEQTILEVANDISGVTSGDDVIILLTINVHLQSYHPDVLRSRLKNLINPIKLLVNKKPNAKILFKGPSPCSEQSKWFDVRIALMFKEVIKQELKDILNYVIYLDTFSIGIAYDNNELHPTGETKRAQIDQFLAYVC